MSRRLHAPKNRSPVSAAALVAIATTLAGPPVATACTTVLIGRSLTADGSVIHAHNEDMGNEAVGRLWAVEPARHGEGETLRVPYVELPQAAEAFGYWASGNAEGAAGLGTSEEVRPYDSVLVGLNERGVSMSCNWAHSREENREGRGIRRYALRQLLLERSTSARHGVEILGALIEEHGQADWGGLIYHLADSREAWVVETTTRNWVARRLRDDEIRVTANRFRIGSDYDLASATVVRDALAEGWLKGPDEELDWSAVYGRPGKMDQPYDTLREARARSLLQRKAGVITPEDLFVVLRDRYESSEHYTAPQTQPVWREDLEKNPALHRTISTNLAQSSFVAHLRGDLPVRLGSLMWYGVATPTWAGYFPLYAGGGALPEEFSTSVLAGADLGEQGRSAWWLFRRLQRAADRDYAHAYPAIHGLWSAEHGLALEHQGRIEARARALLEKGDEVAAARLLSAFTFSRAETTLVHARRLLQLMEPATADNREVQGRGEGKDRWWDALPRAAWSAFRRVEQSQPWFEVYEIRPGVLAIYEPGQFEEVISYLIVGAERALLFDTGLGIGDMRRLAGELTEREVVVLNSHTHYDHVGGNHAFDHVYGTDLDYTNENARGRPNPAVAEFVGEGWIWKETPEGFSTAAYASRPFTIRERVTDGQVISLGGVEVEVLLTPGHAPDSLCLLDRQRRLLFTGDTFYPATLYAHLPGSAFGDYEQTARRLASLAAAVDIVLPAHNEPTLPAAELAAFGDAFGAMRREGTPFVLTDGYREYDFGHFSILVTDPPPWRRKERWAE